MKNLKMINTNKAKSLQKKKKKKSKKRFQFKNLKLQKGIMNRKKNL